MFARDVDLLVFDEGTIVLLQPRSDAAREWLRENVASDAVWFGPSLPVEWRYADAILAGLTEAGLTAHRVH